MGCLGLVKVEYSQDGTNMRLKHHILSNFYSKRAEETKSIESELQVDATEPFPTSTFLFYFYSACAFCFCYEVSRLCVFCYSQTLDNLFGLFFHMSLSIILFYPAVHESGWRLRLELCTQAKHLSGRQLLIFDSEILIDRRKLKDQREAPCIWNITNGLLIIWRQVACEDFNGKFIAQVFRVEF